MNIKTLVLYVIISAFLPLYSMNQDDITLTHEQVQWFSIPKELWTPIIAYCKGKDNVRKTCTYLYNLVANNKLEILTNKLLQLSAKALPQFFMYYGALGKTNIVRNLLAKGARPHVYDNTGTSLMHYAARYGYGDIMTLLLKHPELPEFTVTGNKNSPLYLAMEYNQSAIIDQIHTSYKMHGGEALCHAAKEGSFKIVQTLLAHNIDVNFQDKEDLTPLFYAASEEHLPIMKLLITHGADINCPIYENDDFILLDLAAQDGYTNMVQLLLENGADSNDNRIPLYHALANGHGYTIKLLLDYGVPIKTNAIEEAILTYKNILENDSIKLYIKNPEDTAIKLDRQTLERLTFYHDTLGDGARVRNLLLQGIDPNIQDNSKKSLMHYAAQYGYIDIVTLLLEHPNFITTTIAQDEASPFYLAMKHSQLGVIKQILAACDINGGPVLCYAVGQGLLNVVSTLLASKIDPNAVDDTGTYPLWHAAVMGDVYLPIMKLLITYGALVNNRIKENPAIEKNHIGSTALHWTAILGHRYAAQLLIEHGADVNIKSAQDITPMHAAAEAGHVPILELLISHGAHVNEKDNVGKTALHYAIRNIKIIEKLLACSDININKKDINGNTPLHIAVDFALPSKVIIEKLLAHHDILINIENKQKKTPLDITEKNSRTKHTSKKDKRDAEHLNKIKQILIKHGAKEHRKLAHEDKTDNCVVQ